MPFSRRIRGLLLAGGAATRFGSAKLLHPYLGSTVGAASARNLVAGVGNALAVVREGDDAIAGMLRDAGCEVLVTPRSRDGLAEEVVLLSRAQTELRAGRPANALLALNEHQRKFPRGTLAEERTAARIQALCALGRTDEANAQLKQLASISPNSAHQERARQACRKAGVAP